jgi:hypothetical protein
MMYYLFSVKKLKDVLCNKKEKKVNAKLGIRINYYSIFVNFAVSFYACKISLKVEYFHQL